MQKNVCGFNNEQNKKNSADGSHKFITNNSNNHKTDVVICW